MGLITETNEQYYQGAQGFLSTGSNSQVYATTFDTDLVFGNWNPTTENYALNNFKVALLTLFTINFSSSKNKISGYSSKYNAILEMLRFFNFSLASFEASFFFDNS